MKKSALMASIFLVLATALSGAALAASDGWDTANASNNDDGGNDNPPPDSTTSSSDSDSDDSGFDGATATKDDTSSTGDTSDTEDTDFTTTDTASSTSTDSSWDSENATNDGDGTSTTEEWDTDNATNNDDGTGTKIHNQDNWEGENATNDDDGSATTEEWDTDNATNNDDGSSTESKESEWDTDNATNNDDGVNGDGSDEETEDNQTEEETEEEAEDNQTETTETDDDSDEDVRYDAAEIEIVSRSDTGSSVEIESVDWPNSVRKGNNFQICAEVSASDTPDVTLLKNGVEVETVSQNGNNCFTTSLQQPGDHTLEIRVELDDAQDSETTVINAYTLDTGNKATGSAKESTSTNNGLIIIAILAVIAIGGAAIHRMRD